MRKYLPTLYAFLDSWNQLSWTKKDDMKALMSCVFLLCLIVFVLFSCAFINWDIEPDVENNSIRVNEIREINRIRNLPDTVRNYELIRRGRDKR